MTVRIFVLSGQGGWILSPGMASLAAELRSHGNVSKHMWNDTSVIAAINSTAGPVAVIGHSLGANQLGWYDSPLAGYNVPGIKRRIQFGAAIDPSKQSPLVVWDTATRAWVQNVTKYDKLICWWQAGWIFGGAQYRGPNVENIGPVQATHLGIQFKRAIWDTIKLEVTALGAA